MLQSTVNDILTLIDSYRQFNNLRIEDIQTKADLLSGLRDKNHSQIKKSAKSGVAINLDQFDLSNKIFDSTDKLYNQLELINLENLTWINLSMKYSSYATEKGYTIDLTLDQDSLDHDRKIQLLGLMIVDLEREEKYEYCSMLKEKYEQLSSEIELV